MVIKKYNRGNGKYTIGSQASINASTRGDSTTTTTSSSSSDNYLWGNYNDGTSDIEETIFVNGSVYAMPKLYEDIEENEEDDIEEEEGDIAVYEKQLVQPFEDDEGGNIYAENLIKSFGDIKADNSVESKEVYGNSLFLDYNNIKTNILDLLLPVGSIIMFNGSSSIPNGWAICNGSNGTPNLVGKFIKGIGTIAEIGATGGSANHSLTVEEMPSHNHNATTTTTINLNVEQADPTIKEEWKDKFFIGFKETYYQAFDMGGDKHYTAETGYESPKDKGISEVPIKDLLESAGGVTGSATATSTTTIANTGSGASFNIEPPYYTLIYIMKIS